MGELINKVCTVCRADSSPIGIIECEGLLLELPGWSLIKEANIPRIQRKFSFKDFAHAMAFTNRVAAAAELADHHPAILTEWGQVTVTWWTHSIKGLHLNDFIMAAQTCKLGE